MLEKDCVDFFDLGLENINTTLKVDYESGKTYEVPIEAPKAEAVCSICSKLVENEFYDEDNNCCKDLIFNHDGNKFIYMRYDIFTSTFKCK